MDLHQILAGHMPNRSITKDQRRNLDGAMGAVFEMKAAHEFVAGNSLSQVEGFTARQRGASLGEVHNLLSGIKEGTLTDPKAAFDAIGDRLSTTTDAKSVGIMQKGGISVHDIGANIGKVVQAAVAFGQDIGKHLEPFLTPDPSATRDTGPEMRPGE
ncbi:MAG: hypothetical protein ACYDCF_08720 [Burkholderiales bacterium]